MDLFKKTSRKRLVFFMMSDIVFIFISVWAAFLLRFGYQIPYEYTPFIFKISVLAIVFIIPIFYFQKLYSFSWSYVSTNELILLFKSTTTSFILLGLAVYLLKNYSLDFQNFPRSTIFISYIL